LYELLVGVSPFFTDNIRKLYASIQTAKLPLPSFLSREAMDLLARMLAKNPQNRITIPAIKQHPFFKEIDWAKLEAREIAPPLLLQMDKSAQAEMDEEAKYLAAHSPGDKIFSDKDYDEKNQTLNRVKQFTFVKT
jgi:serine/threonine protein kinase